MSKNATGVDQNREDEDGRISQAQSDVQPEQTKSFTWLCHLGIHKWPEWRTDMERTDTPNGFLNGKRYWSSCRVCQRCYKVDLKQGIEYEQR